MANFFHHVVGRKNRRRRHPPISFPSSFPSSFFSPFPPTPWSSLARSSGPVSRQGLAAILARFDVTHVDKGLACVPCTSHKQDVCPTGQGEGVLFSLGVFFFFWGGGSPVLFFLLLLFGGVDFFLGPLSRKTTLFLGGPRKEKETVQLAADFGIAW